MSAALMVLCGPPLPGRWSLARALKAKLGAHRFLASEDGTTNAEVTLSLGSDECVLVDGDLPSREQRAAVLALGAGADRLLIDWRCPQKEAEHEVFHRYASRPEYLARLEYARYLADSERRDPVEPALTNAQVVAVGAKMPLDEQLRAVISALPPSARIERAMPSRPRVLVVEDDPDQRALLSEVLAELDYQVEPAPDAGVALALLDLGVPFDVVLSDQRMPGMSGVELAREIRERHPRVRAILLTAYGEDPVYQQALDAHAFAVLQKPLRVIDLQRVLEEAALENP